MRGDGTALETLTVGKLTFALDLSKPLWEQVLHQIRGAAARGEINPGDKIPSLRELAQLLKINPNTVMRAYQELERDGLTESRRGQGTFVTSSPEKISEVRNILAEDAVREFIVSLKALGITRVEGHKLLEEASWE